MSLVIGARDEVARVAYLRGEWSQARSELEQALTLARQVGRSWVSVEPLFSLAELCLAQGDQEGASVPLEEAASQDNVMDDLEPLGSLNNALAERDLLQVNEENAHLATERLISLIPRFQRQETDTTMLAPYLAWARLAAGDEDAAEALLDDAIARAASEDMRLALADTLRVRALLRVRQRRWDEAQVALEETLALCRPMPYPYAEAKALFVYGRLHATKGEPGLAREQYEQALAICERLGEGLYRPHIERALEELTLQGG
jgi:ATP/maltotriose-dependent transcriptional regulator MalT